MNVLPCSHEQEVIGHTEAPCVAGDLHIVSIGFIVDEASTTVLGALYGAGAVPTLDHNRLQNGPTPIRVASKATKLQS